MGALTAILEIIGIASSTATAFLSGDAQTGAKISSALVVIVQKALAAHIAQTGQPINPSLLKPFEPLP